ncbi:SAVED domain-containing protein [Acinetobacter sp. SwsAc3]|nr:SAVED domain-containing protein [Acinetobacter sp. SwsAc3]
MDTSNTEPSFDIIQTRYLPLDNIQLAQAYIAAIKNIINWNKVSILRDKSDIDGRKNLLFLLMLDDEILSVLRVNLPKNDLMSFIELTAGIRKNIEVRSLPDRALLAEEITDLNAIQNIWHEYAFTSHILNDKRLKSKFISDFFSHEKKVGRGNPFTKSTLNQVMLDSFGRCMFTGCGERLDIDKLTGRKGNYAYNAHNIASSDNGERGLPFLSSALSNDPENVLLLCDKHHRLIDKVAPSDYDSLTLNKMRNEHKKMAQQLLDALAFEPIPVYSVLWPVHGQAVSNPDLKEIASSLHPLKYKINGCLNTLCNSNIDPELFKEQMIRHIEIEARKIINQTQNENYKAAIFAFGPMPALIGLGALLGNKAEFIPMLKFRDSQKWEWPSPTMVDPFNEIIGLDKLKKNNEVVLCIHATAKVDRVLEKAKQLAESIDNQVVEISTLPEYMGSKSIPHPLNVKALTAQIQKLLHHFKSNHGIELVHLFITAPNAACVAIGQGIDKNHPDVIIYDYKQAGLESVLRINSTENGNELISV